MNQQHMLLKLRKPILKYTLNNYHVHWLSSFKHLKLPISIKIHVTTYLWQIIYIYMTAISMNYAYAKLVVAWLYWLLINHIIENNAEPGVMLHSVAFHLVCPVFLCHIFHVRIQRGGWGPDFSEKWHKYMVP